MAVPMPKMRSRPICSLFSSLQPIGIAIAQILSFYAANRDEFGRSDPIRALVLASIVALVVWAIAWRPAGGPRRAALITSFAGILFWSTTSIGKAFSSTADGLTAASFIVIAGLWCIALPAVAHFIARTPRKMSLTSVGRSPRTGKNNLGAME